MSKLTIGMITYDDFDGVYFTLQSLRLHHPEAMNDVEFIIIDNNPDSNHGKEVKNLTGWGTGKVRYVGFTEFNSTAVRTKIFEMATTPYVLCLDCHVLLSLGAVKRLIDFFEAGKDEGNLLQGPMLYDDLKGYATHFDLVWREQMWGIWGTDERGGHVNNEPFEIPAQGLGLFACRKDSWLGFNPFFRGFGGEEGYIHEKYRKVQYVGFTEYNSTAVRTKIFEMATTPYVLCLDCHVLLSLGAVKKLIDFFEAGKDEGNLLQGPMLYDDLKGYATHFDLVWREQMWGIWGTDERGGHVNNEPFEIPAQGLGLFACRKDSWLGFNPFFRGFGGEEGYIHEKYRKAGKKTLCLPFLQWMHRFGRPNGIKYPITLDNKVRNYFIGHLELGMNVSPIIEHFKPYTPMENLVKLYDEAKRVTRNS